MTKGDPPPYNPSPVDATQGSKVHPQEQTQTYMPQTYMLVPAPETTNQCPAGGYHQFKTEYSICGICWLICCFPLGILCFLGSRQYVCLNCGAERI